MSSSSMMKRALLVGAVSVAAACGLAQGSTVYAAGFEAPTFALGNIHGQDGWVSVTGSPAAGQADVVQNVFIAHSGSRYLQTDTVVWPTGTGADGRERRSIANNASRTSTQISTGGGQIHASVYLNMGAATGTRSTQAGIELNGSNDDGLLRIGTIEVFSNGDVLVSPAPDSSGGDPLSPSFIIDHGLFGSWVSLEMIADFNIGKVSYFINHVDRTQDLINLGFDNSFTATALSSVDLIATRFSPETGQATGGSRVLWDDLSVQLVPTPGAAVLLGLGGLVAARRRRN